MKVNRTWLLVGVVVAAVVVLYLVNHFTSTQSIPNSGEMAYPSGAGQEMAYDHEDMSVETSEVQGHDGMVAHANAPEHSAPNQNSGMPLDLQMRENMTGGVAPKDQLAADELLPQGQANLWAQVHPEGQGSLKDQNFLQAGHHYGIDTVGQTLRNANRQIRSEPPNPQVATGIWNQSTIQPDLNRRPMEIGGCNQF